MTYEILLSISNRFVYTDAPLDPPAIMLTVFTKNETTYYQIALYSSHELMLNSTLKVTRAITL